MDEESQLLLPPPAKSPSFSTLYGQGETQVGNPPVGNLMHRKYSLHPSQEIVYSPAPKSTNTLWSLDWNIHSNNTTEVRNRRLIKRKSDAPQQSSGNVFIRKRIKKQTWWSYYGKDWFHSLVDAPTSRIVLILMSCYLFVTFLFALFYYYIHCHYSECNLGFNTLIGAFDFALETMATIGYGAQDIFFGDCLLVTMLLTTQVCIHMIVDAIVIGVIYCRLARPNTRATTIIFSDKAILRRIRGKVYFMFQLCELRKHQLVEAHIRVYVMKKEVDLSTTTPNSYLQSCQLRLNHPNDELGGMLLLMVPQLIVHELTANSPLMPPPLWVKNRTGEVKHWRPPVCEVFHEEMDYLTAPSPSHSPSHSSKRNSSKHSTSHSPTHRGHSSHTGQSGHRHGANHRRAVRATATSLMTSGSEKGSSMKVAAATARMRQHVPVFPTSRVHSDDSDGSEDEYDYYDTARLSNLQFPNVNRRHCAECFVHPASMLYPSPGIAQYSHDLSDPHQPSQPDIDKEEDRRQYVHSYQQPQPQQSVPTSSSSKKHQQQQTQQKDMKKKEGEEHPWQKEEREMIQEYLHDRQIEVIAIVEGIDSATGGNVQARQSYVLDEIAWNKSYQYCMFQDPEDEFTTIDFDLFHELQDAPSDAAYPGPIVSSL